MGSVDQRSPNGRPAMLVTPRGGGDLDIASRWRKTSPISRYNPKPNRHPSTRQRCREPHHWPAEPQGLDEPHGRLPADLPTIPPAPAARDLDIATRWTETSPIWRYNPKPNRHPSTRQRCRDRHHQTAEPGLTKPYDGWPTLRSSESQAATHPLTGWPAECSRETESHPATNRTADRTQAKAAVIQPRTRRPAGMPPKSGVGCTPSWCGGREARESPARDRKTKAEAGRAAHGRDGVQPTPRHPT